MDTTKAAAPAGGKWPFWPVFAMLVVAWLGFCWPWLSAAVTVPWDAKAHFYPQLRFLAQSLDLGESYAWAPFVFSGSPQIADPQSLIFSPPHHFLARLSANPGFAAADAVPFLGLLAGAGAILLYFRDRNWHPAGALVAAIAFAFGGSAAWRIQHVGQIMSLSYFPIVLLLLDRAMVRTSLVYGAAAGVFAALLLLGRDQVAGLSALVLAAYGASHVLGSERRWPAFRQVLPPLLAAAGTAIVLIFVPLAMTGILASASNRSHIDLAGAERGSLHPGALITAFLANIFGTNGEFKEFWGPPSPLWGWLDLYIARNMSNVYSGALVVLAVAFGAAGGGLWAKGARFFGLALLVMLLYALGRYTPFFSAIYHAVPGIDLFRRPADGTFLIGALAAFAAGHVFHVLLSAQTPLVSRAARIAISSSLAAVLAGIALALAKGRLGYAWPMIAEGAAWLAAGMGIAAFAARRLATRPLLAALLLGGFLTADLIRNNGPNESTALPPSMYETLRGDGGAVMRFLKEKTALVRGSDRLDRVELAAIDFHTPNASLIHRLHNTLGYNPVRSRIYTEAVGAGDHVALPDQRAFPPLFPSYASPLANLLGLRWLATAVPLDQLDKNLSANGLPQVFRDGQVSVYENEGALPRVMMVPRAMTADFEVLVRSGQWPITNFRDTVLLAAIPPGASGLTGAAGGTARILRYQNGYIEIEASSEGGGYLLLNDPWHPWWSVWINGYVGQIHRANVLFRAVMLPPGRHRVEFVFQPMRGLWLSLTDWLSARPIAP